MGTRRYDLWNQQIVLLNRTSLPYSSTHSSLLRRILRKGGTPEQSLSFHSLQRCYGCYRKDMRLFIALLSLSFVFTACKARTPVPVGPEVAKATPAPSATPIPGTYRSEITGCRALLPPVRG